MSDPLLIPELLLALMSLQSMAAFLILANSAGPRKEGSSSKGMDAAVTACVQNSHCHITTWGSGGVGCLARLDTDGVN